MLQYDLTGTRLFNATSREQLPTDAEMFSLTAAFLVLRDAAYSDLNECELILSLKDVEDFAHCIEMRLPSFIRDLGRDQLLRERITDFVGLRITCLSHARQPDRRGRR